MSNKDKVVYLHTPKTGGGSMEWYFWNQTKHLKTFFLSFNGIDYSHFNDDELATKGPKGNKCLIEVIHRDSRIVDTYNASPHFDACRLLLGHTTSSIGDLFPKYNFEYMMVIREPIERTISHLCQYSAVPPRTGVGVKFGRNFTQHPKYSPEYWDFIYDIITKPPVPGLLTHENAYLSNCMSKIIIGSKLSQIDEPIELQYVKWKAKDIRISTYDNFNEGIQQSFDHFNIPIDMSNNVFAQKGKPSLNPNKKKTGKYYGAPQKVIDFVTETNQTDIQFYNWFTS